MERSEATVVFTVQPVGWVGEWHENPAPQWIVVLSGRWWIESMDGTRIEQGPGEFSLGEDQGCTETDGKKGHRSGTIGNEPCCLMTVQLHVDPRRAAMPAELTFRAIVRFRLVTADPVRLAAFYRAIGFDVGDAAPHSRFRDGTPRPPGHRLADRDVARHEAASISTASSTRVAPIRQRRPPAISFSNISRSSPTMRAAAWRRARDAGAAPISREGPVTLPRSAGGVTAVKFRDPEGHPLEFLQFPPEANSRLEGQRHHGHRP